MAISYPLSWPTTLPRPREVVFRPRKVVGVAESPGSLVAQVYEWPGERWEADITWPLMSRANGEAWVGWWDSLRGPVGSFLFGDPENTSPRGSATSGSITGAAQARTVTGSGSGTLKAGDWLQVTSGGKQRLHKVLVDTTVGTSIEIWPALRAAATGAAITLASPRGLFMLPGNQQISHTVTRGLGDSRVQLPTITVVEDLRP